jgi:hypothetical protein
MKKLAYCFTVVACVLFCINTVSAIDLSPKEAELLRQNVSFFEEGQVTRFGGVEIYSKSTKKSPEHGLEMERFVGCIPIETSSGDAKQFHQIIFDFSISRGQSQTAIASLITSYKRSMVFPQKTFAPCTSKETLDETKIKKEKEGEREKKKEKGTKKGMV